jgi:cytosine/adenosine deaminase-related metal-dependent hydrolase
MLGRDMTLITSDKGKVLQILPTSEAGDDIESLKGLLTPGFVNCHCHLELSHLKGLIPEKTGLVDFVFTVVTQRHFPEQGIYEAISRGEEEMLANGIVAVGDICNNTLTLPQKQQGKLTYYNFIELSGWLPGVAEARFSRSKSFYDEYRKLLPEDQRLSMAPHAPYSVSDELWGLMAPWLANKTTTIHNQETSFEDEFFRSGTGDFLRMYRMMNMDLDFFQPPGKSSLQSCLPKLSGAKNLLLVHNTFTSEEDLDFALNPPEPGANLYFCLCVNANRYIENALPPISLLRKYHCNIVLGTDSLASNHRLDILDEMKTIMRHFPDIPQTEILQWATINGAKALELDDRLGSFEPGKQPGIVLIENLDGEKPGSGSSAKKIL